jgi:hypothetical protein
MDCRHSAVTTSSIIVMASRSACLSHITPSQSTEICMQANAKSYNLKPAQDQEAAASALMSINT